MRGSKQKGAKPVAARQTAGQAHILDVVPTSWVVVPSPRSVPSGTPIEVDGQSGMMSTDHLHPLSLESHDFRVVAGTAVWEGSAFIPEGGTEARPISVPLKAAGAVQSLSVERPTTAAGSTIVATGRPAGVRTVIFVHGIGNKPIASVLRCQWDKALFGHEMGDRSRMAYWVNRDRYPRPLDGSCDSGDLVATDDDEASTAAILAIGAETTQLAGAAREDAAIERTINSTAKNAAQKAALRKIAAATVSASDARTGALQAASPGQTSTRILPGNQETRRTLARLLTRATLPDVYDFLFDPARHRQMVDALTQRMRGGGEPFVIVAHSLGSLIAYDVLRRLKKEDCDVALFVTIGSPLGLQEVEDYFQQDGGTLKVPDCVGRWCNFADRLDPVAIDQTLAGDYVKNGDVAVEDFQVENADSPLHPHSGTGYLSTAEVRHVVTEIAGAAFVQRLTEMVVTRDVAAAAENAPGTTQEVLIQLSDTLDDAEPRPLSELAKALVGGLERIAKQNNRTLEKPDVLRRFVTAKLMASEIDSLRTLSEELHIKQVWANAVKRTLIGSSVSTVQALPARLGYSATGAGINWAVLDTGIDDEHPHFQHYKNVRGQWDCTQSGDPRPMTGPEQRDPNGHGTHVAGIIGGGMDGVLVGAAPVQLYGMAPQVGLYGFRVLDNGGAGNDGWIIKALDKIAEMNEQSSALLIHGVNLSLGSNFDPSIYGCGHTPLCQELRRLWRQGVLICVAAGNEGYAELQSANGIVNANMGLSIGDPANLDEAIAVGSVHKTKPHSYGVSYFSSRGPTADGRRKPDLVAPGEKILSALANGRVPAGHAADARDLYVEKSGTSMAAPHVSGLLAAFLSVRREFIGDPDRTKEVLLGACTDLKRDPNMQGAGLPNLVRMVLDT